MKKLVVLGGLLLVFFSLSAQSYFTMDGNKYEVTKTEYNKSYHYSIINGELKLSYADSSQIYFESANRISCKISYYYDGESGVVFTYKNRRGLDSLNVARKLGHSDSTESRYDNKDRLISISNKGSNGLFYAYFIVDYVDKKTKTGSICFQTSYYIDKKNKKNKLQKIKYTYNEKGEEIAKETLFPKEPSISQKHKNQFLKDTITIIVENKELNKPDELIKKYYNLAKSSLEDKTKTTVSLLYQNEDKSVKIHFMRCGFQENPRAELITKQLK